MAVTVPQPIDFAPAIQTSGSFIVTHVLAAQRQRDTVPTQDQFLAEVLQDSVSLLVPGILTMSRDELDGYLEELLDSEAFVRLQQKVVVHMTGAAHVALPRNDVPVTALCGPHFDDKTNTKLQELDRMGALLVSALTDLIRHNPDADLTNCTAKVAADPLGVITAIDVPAEVALLFLKMQKASVAGLVLAALVMEEESKPPPVATALIQIVHEGTYALCRLFASLPGSTIVTSVVPQEDRLDLDSLYTRAFIAEIGFQQLCRDHDESN